MVLPKGTEAEVSITAMVAGGSVSEAYFFMRPIFLFHVSSGGQIFHLGETSTSRGDIALTAIWGIRDTFGCIFCSSPMANIEIFLI